LTFPSARKEDKGGEGAKSIIRGRGPSKIINREVGKWPFKVAEKRMGKITGAHRKGH